MICTRNLIDYIRQAGRTGQSAECAIYTRAASGILTRTEVRIDYADTMEHYEHEERLDGWPERRVFWTSATGAAVGAAPLKF